MSPPQINLFVLTPVIVSPILKISPWCNQLGESQWAAPYDDGLPTMQSADAHSSYKCATWLWSILLPCLSLEEIYTHQFLCLPSEYSHPEAAITNSLLVCGLLQQGHRAWTGADQQDGYQLVQILPFRLHITTRKRCAWRGRSDRWDWWKLDHQAQVSQRTSCSGAMGLWRYRTQYRHQSEAIYWVCGQSIQGHPLRNYPKKNCTRHNHHVGRVGSLPQSITHWLSALCCQSFEELCSPRESQCAYSERGEPMETDQKMAAIKGNQLGGAIQEYLHEWQYRRQVSDVFGDVILHIASLLQ